MADRFFKDLKIPLHILIEQDNKSGSSG